MERITISIENALAEQFDRFIGEQGYTNRSEAVRDMIRQRLETERLEKSDQGYCVATLSYVYNHHEMALSSRITSAQHEHHELTLSSMHVHLDHDHCLEVVVLQGPVAQVRTFADAVMAERGVRHGKVHMISISVDETSHGGARHAHSRPSF
jgi:CopG family nickel-responsive transcriptional regulator